MSVINLVLATVWLGLAAAAFILPSVHPEGRSWTVPNTSISIGWVALVFCGYNMARWWTGRLKAQDRLVLRQLPRRGQVALLARAHRILEHQIGVIGEGGQALRDRLPGHGQVTARPACAGHPGHEQRRVPRRPPTGLPADGCTRKLSAPTGCCCDTPASTRR